MNNVLGLREVEGYFIFNGRSKADVEFLGNLCIERKSQAKGSKTFLRSNIHLWPKMVIHQIILYVLETEGRNNCKHIFD